MSPIYMYMSIIYVYCTAEKGSEKERLLHGETDDIKPRLRTPQEIMAAYRKAGVMKMMVLILTKDFRAV